MSSPVPWEESVSFEACTSFFEKVVREQNKQRRGQKLAKFLEDLRRVKEEKGGESLYPVMRLLLPAIDRERGAYGIKESVLAKMYIDLLKLGPTSNDAIKLKNYRAPKNNQSDAGDFAAVLFTVIKDRHYSNTNISVKAVNDSLNDIVSANANEGRRGVERILLDLFKRMSDIQQKWLVRIILKDMKLQLGQKSIMNAFHPDANDLFDVNANLRKVCQMLKDPKVRMNEIEIEIFEPFKPMLADRCVMKDIAKTMNHKDFYIEVKYDGERMQLHKDGSDKFRFFSRNGFDFTDDFGHSPREHGKFCGYVARALDKSVKSIILDGEICAYNHQSSTLTQKGEQMNIRNLRPDDPVYQQCLYVYDVVYLNGEVLTNKPLRERIEVLKKAVRVIEGRVHYAERKVGVDKKDVVLALNDAIDRREEGIVVKDPESVYKPNVRSKGGWVKVKPEYSGSLMDQCDLIIMGGYFGSGRRGGGLVTHFLLGVAVKGGGDGGGGEHPKEFHSFCRVGSGYSMKELSELLQRLQPHFKPGRPSSSGPVKLEFGKEKPDVWIDPRKSVLLQVKAAEIVASDNYKTGCTLRFPRVEKVREESDKPWHACMTLGELETIRKEGEGKLASRHMALDEGDEEGEPSSKRRRTTRASAKPVGVSSLYRSADLSQIMVETHDLKDKVIVVEPCDADLKTELEAIVTKHGGTCDQNVREKRTFCYVETGFKLRAKNVVRSGKYDVVKSGWLLDCKTKFRPFRPSDMMFTTKETKAKFAREYDKFGDSYTQRATVDSLKYSMEKVSELKEEVTMTQADIAEFESRYFPGPFKYGLFRQFSLYVDRNAAVGDSSTAIELHPLDLVLHTLRFYGGHLAGALEPGLTHVVVHSSDLGRMNELRALRRKRREKFHIVTENWVESCLEKVELLDERDFEPE